MSIRSQSAPATSHPSKCPGTPVIRGDLAEVRRRHSALHQALPGVHLHYAVKANSAPAVLQTLADCGVSWDIAGVGEIDEVRHITGSDAASMSFGNTVKRSADIAYAHSLGIRRFSLDAVGELDKLTEFASGSTVLVRLATSGEDADMPLGEKFGCPEGAAAELLLLAAERGHRLGVCFHVGTQQHNPNAWDAPLAATARIRERLRSRGADLSVINLGGGFPVRMEGLVPPIADFGRAICDALRRHLGWTPTSPSPVVMAEPGRFLVADAAVLETEVLLVTRRAGLRWVHLDAGLFTGLMETIGEQIRYRLEVLRDGALVTGPSDEVVLAGPTCDSLDVLYRWERQRLPLALRAGDVVRFAPAGAYVAAYSTVGFNGFAPLRQIWT